jgi:hypothetical protein
LHPQAAAPLGSIDEGLAASWTLQSECARIFDAVNSIISTWKYSGEFCAVFLSHAARGFHRRVSELTGLFGCRQQHDGLAFDDDFTNRNGPMRSVEADEIRAVITVLLYIQQGRFICSAVLDASHAPGGLCGSLGRSDSYQGRRRFAQENFDSGLKQALAPTTNVFARHCAGGRLGEPRQPHSPSRPVDSAGSPAIFGGGGDWLG